MGMSKVSISSSLRSRMKASKESSAYRRREWTRMANTLLLDNTLATTFGMIPWKQAVDHFIDFGMTFGNSVFAVYAQAYGAQGQHVSVIGDLVPTLERSFQAGGIHLVAVPIDYSDNQRVLVDEVRRRARAT